MSKPTVVETNPHAAFARDVPSLPPTTDLDSLVEMLESAIVEHGLDAVSLATFGQRALQDGGDDAHDWLVELFRVWLEHAWMRGRQLTPSECLSLFPHITLSPHQLETLEFEYQRLRRTSHSIASQQRNQRPVALPDVGTRWANFELLQSLGTGAYSHVYLARQTDFANRLVALKLTSQQTSESATLARLQHTAIVPVFSTYVHQQLYGICMPYLGNTTLADFVTSQPRGTEATAERRTTFSVVGRSLLETLSARQSRITTIVTESPGTPDAHQKAAQVEPTPTGATSFLPVTSLSRSPAAKQLTSLNSVETILWIVAQVADGLAHAHRHKVLHCDIKPANILLGADGQPRLLDFNISLDASKRGQPRGLGGTPAYMAPEHLAAIHQDGEIDERSDIYSLGAVCYELLTGRLPARSSSPLSANITPPSKLRPEVTPAIDAIVLRCLQAAPEQRYASADQLYEDLQAQLAHRPLVHQVEPSARERLSKWKARHPAICSASTVVACALILLISTLVGWYYQYRKTLVAHAQQRAQILQDLVVPLSISLGTMERDEALPTLLDVQPRIVNFVDPQELTPDRNWFNRLDKSTSNQVKANGQLLLRMIESSQILAPRSAPGSDPTKADLPNELRQPIRDLISRLMELLPSEEIETRDATIYAIVERQLEHKEFSAALEQLKPFLAQHPTDYTACYFAGLAAQGAGKFDEAEDWFTSCTILDPRIPEGWVQRGLARYSQQQFAAAAEDFSYVIDHHPQRLIARLNRAQARKELGLYREAFQDLQYAHDHDFRSVHSLRLAAILSRHLGDRASAVTFENEARETSPVTGVDWVDSGLLHSQKDPQRAAEAFREAMRINPQYALAYQNLSAIQSGPLNQTEAAIRTLTDLLGFRPELTAIRASRAVLFARTGKFDEAFADLDLLKSEPLQDAMTMYQIACVYSLAAEAKSPNNDESINSGNLEYLQHSLQWTLRALSVDPKLYSLIESDPDSRWLRSQKPYSQLVEVLLGRDSNSK